MFACFEPFVPTSWLPRTLYTSQLLVPLLLFDATEPNSQESQENATLSVATLKLPEFRPADSELLFIHIEAQFRCHRVASHSLGDPEYVERCSESPFVNSEGV